MTGQGLSPAGMDVAPQLPKERIKSSSGRGHDEISHGCGRDDHSQGDADVVDAEADVVDTLLTMRELASNTSGNDRVLQVAASTQGYLGRESAEDEQGPHRSDSAATGPTGGTAPCISRDGLNAHRQTFNFGQGAGLGSRPNSGVASNTLVSRPNSFTGKKRKPGVADEEPATATIQAAPLRDIHDCREAGALMTADAASLYPSQHLTSASGVDAFAWRQGAASTGGGSSGTLPIGRVSSEPIINGCQRLHDSMLAKLGLGAAAGDTTAMERLRAVVLGATTTNGVATNDSSAPSAKRPHVLSRQASTAAAAAAAAHSISAEDLQHHQQQQQQQQQQQHHRQLGAAAAKAAAAAALAAVAAGERPPSGRQDRSQQPHFPGASVKTEGLGGEDPTDPGSGGAVGVGSGAASGESPGVGAGEHMTYGPGPTAVAAVAAAAAGAGAVGGGTGYLGLRGPAGTHLCAPPSSPRGGHHSDTGSDSGSPSKRALYSSSSRAAQEAQGGRERKQQQQQQQPSGRGGAAITAAVAGSGGADGEELTAPSGPHRTSSVISLLHTLAIHQEQQRQQQEQQRPYPGQGQGGQGRAAPPVRLAELAELVGAADAAMAGEDLLSNPRVAAVAAAAAMAAAGYPVDAAAARDGGIGGPYGSGKLAGRGGGGGGGSSTLHCQMSYSSKDYHHIGTAGPGGKDPMQVDSSSSPPLRTVSGIADVQAFLQPTAASRSAVAGVPERCAMDCDVPLTSAAAAAAAAAGLPGSAGAGLPYNAAATADAGNERIHATLAAIERKLLLQEERLVYELKQVRLMQKLLQVQQMKQMVREAMRGRDRDAAVVAMAAAAAGMGLGPDGLLNGSSPFPTAAAPQQQQQQHAAAADTVVDGGGLARLPSLPPHILAAAARAMAAANASAAAEPLPREHSSSGIKELLRASSDAAAVAAAAAAAATFHGGQSDLAEYPPQGYQSQHPHQGKQQQQQQPSHHQPQRRSGLLAREVEATRATQHLSPMFEEALGSRGTEADAAGRLLSYIASLSNNNRGMPTAAHREGTTVGAVGTLGGGSEADGASAWQHAHTGGNGAAGPTQALHNSAVDPITMGKRGLHDDGGGGGLAALGLAPTNGQMSEEEEQQILLERRIIQMLLRQQQEQQQQQRHHHHHHQHPEQKQKHMQDHVLASADGSAGEKSNVK